MTRIDILRDRTNHTRVDMTSDTMIAEEQPHNVNESRQQITRTKPRMTSVANTLLPSLSAQDCKTKDFNVFNKWKSRLYSGRGTDFTSYKVSPVSPASITKALVTRSLNTSASPQAMTSVKPLLQDIPEMYQRVSIQTSSNCDTPICLQQRTVCQSSNKSQTSFQARLNVPFTVLQMFYWTSLFLMTKTAFVQGELTIAMLQSKSYQWSQDLGPRYRNARRMCLSDLECNMTMGEVCWWAWDGCSAGECMCDPRNSFHDSFTGSCRPLRYGDEECIEGDRCWEGMSCRNGFCRCDQGIMTSDKTFCLRERERLLGQQCTVNHDICYQRAAHGYTRKETYCDFDGRCHCEDGYKEDGRACRKWNVNEAGCDKDHHCQGGALCIDNQCLCPSRYMPVARHSKCAKRGAEYDLGLGETCDEINERKYCAYGVVCHQCAGNAHYSCVKFVEAEALPYLVSSSSRNAVPIPTWPLVTILLLLYFLFKTSHPSS